MRRHARARMARFANVRYLDLSRPERFPSDPRFDVILVNSVCQYMTPDEFSGWLGYWRKMLAPGGKIVISDLIPPDYRGGRDLLHLLRFSARRGFLLRAVAQAVGEIFRYYRTRQARPLTRFGKEELSRRGQEAGLAVEFLPRNLTHFPERITAIFSHCSGDERN
jgi:SAM-dependent methyltransferase